MIEFQNPQTHPHFQQYSRRYPLKKNKNNQVQALKVHQMLNQVNQILDHLLKDLEYLYKANGINYIIGHYHNTLIRILTPFELLSHFQIANNEDLFNLEDASKVNENFKVNQAIVKKQSLCFTPGYIKKEQQQNNEDFEKKRIKKSKHANKKYFYRKDRTKPILDYETESVLTEWALKKLSQGKRVRRKDLAIKALKLSGNQEGFYGSIGWVNRFLNRHVKLKQQIMKVARSNIGIRRAYIEDSQLQENDVEFQRLCHNTGAQILAKEEFKQQDDYNDTQIQDIDSQDSINYQNQDNKMKFDYKIFEQKSANIVEEPHPRDYGQMPIENNNFYDKRIGEHQKMESIQNRYRQKDKPTESRVIKSISPSQLASRKQLRRDNSGINQQNT